LCEKKLRNAVEQIKDEIKDEKLYLAPGQWQ
jgi:hypothetical protein